MGMSQAELEKIFVKQLVAKYRSANFDCLIGADELPFDEPTTFDYDFEPKGTIRVLLPTADDPNDPHHITFCTPYLYFIKELARRTQYNVTALFSNNDEPPIPTSISPEAEESGLNLLYQEKVDLFLNPFFVNPSRFQYMRPVHCFAMEALFYVLGSVYPKQYNIVEKFIQMSDTFDSIFWTGFFLVLFGLPFLIVYVQKYQRQLRKAKEERKRQSRRRAPLQRHYLRLFLRRLSEITPANGRRHNTNLFIYYFNQISIILTAVMFSNNLHQALLRNRGALKWIYLAVTVFGFIVNELFTSNMHLLLIFPPHEVIESVQDLHEKSDLKLITVEMLSYMRSERDDLEREIFSRPRKEYHDMLDVLMRLGDVFDLVGQRKSHVMIVDDNLAKATLSASKYANEMIPKGAGSSDESMRVELHLSAGNGFRLPTSMLYRKGLDKAIVKPLVDITRTAFEMGSYKEWYEVTAAFGGKIAKIFQDVMGKKEVAVDAQEAEMLSYRESLRQFARSLESIFVAGLLFVCGVVIATAVFVFEFAARFF